VEYAPAGFSKMGRTIYTPPGGPPQGPGPSKEIYGLMGEANIYKMMSDLYKELGTSEVRHLFPQDLEAASRKSAAFFIGLLGGPPIYIEKYGSPRMRARHLPFEIDERARKAWLACFERVLEDAETKYNFPSQHLPGFKDFLVSFSAWMVNKA
jgi:hemoglobin